MVVLTLKTKVKDYVHELSLKPRQFKGKRGKLVAKVLLAFSCASQGNSVPFDTLASKIFTAKLGDSEIIEVALTLEGVQYSVTENDRHLADMPIMDATWIEQGNVKKKVSLPTARFGFEIDWKTDDMCFITFSGATKELSGIATACKLKLQGMFQPGLTILFTTVSPELDDEQKIIDYASNTIYDKKREAVGSGAAQDFDMYVNSEVVNWFIQVGKCFNDTYSNSLARRKPPAVTNTDCKMTYTTHKVYIPGNIDASAIAGMLDDLWVKEVPAADNSHTTNYFGG